MADNKKTGKKPQKKAVKPPSKTQKTAKNAPEKPIRRPNKNVEAVDEPLHQVLPYLLGALSLFLLICFLSQGLTGFIGRFFRWLFYGCFGTAAFAIPVLLLILAFFWRKELRKGTLLQFAIFQGLFFLFFAAMLHLWSGGTRSFDLGGFWNGAQSLRGGGFVGGLLGVCLYKLTGTVGAHIIGISALLIFGLFMFGLTPYSIYVYIAYYLHERKERLAAEEAESAARETSRGGYAKPETVVEEDEVYCRVTRDPVDRHRFEPDVAVDGTDAPSPAEPSDEDVPPFDLAVTRETVKPLDRKIGKRPDSVLPEKETGEKVDLQGIFTDPDGVDVIQRFADEQKRKAEAQMTQNTDATLEVTRTAVADEPPTELIKKEYEFPPISLLRRDNSPKNIDISEELHTNATKLVETLRSFKVRTRIVNVSRGPAITRYELAPEEGVRVRAIANLVDDIALNLATSGVRIEAPIPGKAAVGIEVPNKSVSTVFLRELVDTETFRKAASKLNVSLGVDVAGDPVFLDIAKMPHLLIAGATGMGKSVCINSIITSLLYKGSPEEVKLILIDPKKVELNIYNGLPHLLVPVVSDPKKAAGSLQWAVTEMERRFEMIEDVGVRDIKNYNLVTKDDPDREFMPQIVIIIDELADLMMTAPDDVEASICRLAQKARAAGMHLIIGTQRPSTDVITGLIKANVPSRIAFTVASQVDSRVVLDMGGAEKLIGRGDMLYAPVGAAKPRRVQGAFVSESEVESIVTFIKEQSGGQAEYSSDIIESIDRAAASCGNGKKSGGAEGDLSDDGGDPMLRQAIELAIESGKISTSLIQRRLSLGYGRAAKLIDEMEKRGFVSAPEGQKPRSVLITKQQYMEMVLDRGEEL